jgi:hypothetical protein
VGPNETVTPGPVQARTASEVIATTLTGTDPAELRLSWRVDGWARRRLEQRLFGKRILFTNRDDWPVADVVAAYRSQSEAEAGFRQLKDDMYARPPQLSARLVRISSSGA